MDAPYYNGGPDKDYGMLGRRTGSRPERVEDSRRRFCRRCFNEAWTPYYIPGYGTVCSEVCRQHVETARAKSEVA